MIKDLPEPNYGFFWEPEEVLENCDEQLDNLSDESDWLIFP